jgi:hypothetical protein
MRPMTPRRRSPLSLVAGALVAACALMLTPACGHKDSAAASGPAASAAKAPASLPKQAPLVDVRNSMPEHCAGG